MCLHKLRDCVSLVIFYHIYKYLILTYKTLEWLNFIIIFYGCFPATVR